MGHGLGDYSHCTDSHREVSPVRLSSATVVLGFTKCRGGVGNSGRCTTYSNDYCSQTLLQKIFRGGKQYIGAVIIAERL